MKIATRTAVAILTVMGGLFPAGAKSYTIHVDAGLGTDQPFCGSVPGPWACRTIQYAFDNLANPGATILLAPGTYTENIVLDTHVILEGAGSGVDPAVDSIIVSAAPSTNVIRLLAGGASATDRMIIRNVRVTGGTGGPNYGNGINIVSGSHITFDNVASVGNDGNGIAFDPGGDQADIVVAGCNLSDNPGGTGFRVPTTASVDGLAISNSSMDSNAVIGLSMYGPVTGLVASNSTFNNNGVVGIYGYLHRDFVTPAGATIDNVVANGNGRGIALRIYGGSVTISNSTAISNNNPNPGDIGQGIDLSVRGADTEVILDNVTAADNEDVNIFLETKYDGSLTSATFAAVTATGSTDEPTALFCDGCGIWLHALGTVALANVSISNSVITGNNRGIILDAETMPVTNVSITGSRITGNSAAAGIFLSDGAAAGNQAHGNIIRTNSMGVENLDPDDVFDATENWWGHDTGPFQPATNPSGMGDEVSDNVAYDPWTLFLAIFDDGFESGNTSAWSSTVP